MNDDDQARRGARVSDLTRIEDLARSFPALSHADGVRPFDPDRLERWSSKASSGEYHAVRFLLAVWSGGRAAPPFLVFDALNTWDGGNRKAFQAWAAAPWAR